MPRTCNNSAHIYNDHHKQCERPSIANACAHQPCHGCADKPHPTTPRPTQQAPVSPSHECNNGQMHPVMENGLVIRVFTHITPCTGKPVKCCRDHFICINNVWKQRLCAAHEGWFDVNTLRCTTNLTECRPPPVHDVPMTTRPPAPTHECADGQRHAVIDNGSRTQLLSITFQSAGQPVKCIRDFFVCMDGRWTHRACGAHEGWFDIVSKQCAKTIVGCHERTATTHRQRAPTHAPPVRPTHECVEGQKHPVFENGRI
jgi:hypothetical protein